MDIKTKRGVTYAAALVVGFFAILAIQHGCDSSAYTFNGEKINRIGLSIFFGLIGLGVAYYFVFVKKKKK